MALSIFNYSCYFINTVLRETHITYNDVMLFDSGDGVSYVFGPKYGIYWDQWSDFTCKARAYAYITAEVCSNVLAAFFSVVRALALYKPLFSKRYLTPTRIRHLIEIMLAYILLVCTPAW